MRVGSKAVMTLVVEPGVELSVAPVGSTKDGRPPGTDGLTPRRPWSATCTRGR
jgi:hypothetical protein